MSQKSLSHSSGMVCVASPLALDSGQLFPVQLGVPLDAAYSRGGLELVVLDPEGTSGIPLCSCDEEKRLVWRGTGRGE